MLEIIITSSVLILIIMLLRAFCRKSIKPTLRYVLWLVVAVRLLLPFSLFSSNASVMNFFGKAEMVEPPAPSADINVPAPSDPVSDTPAFADADNAFVPEDYTAPDVQPSFGQGNTDPISPTDQADQADILIPQSPDNPSDTINPIEPDSDYAPPVLENFPQQNTPEPPEVPVAPIEPIENEGVQPTISPDITSYENRQPALSLSLFGRSIEIRLWLVNAVKAGWLIVAAAMGIWFFGVNIAFSVSLRKNRRELDINAPLKVYATPSLASPCLFGLFRPAVYVNEKAARDESSLRFVIAHEYCHYRHGDMFWSLLRCVLVSVYWFNPLVWAAAYLSKRDCECSCDEAAIKLLGEPSRISYGKALVSMIPERRANPRLIGVASTSMSGSKRAVRERVRLIAKKPKNTVIAVVLTIAVLVAAVGCTFTSADNDKVNDLSETDTNADVADPENQPDNPDEPQDNDPAGQDNHESINGIRIEQYDPEELNSLRYADTKPFILPINTPYGVKDCKVHVKYEGEKPVGVFEFSPLDDSLIVLSSGRDYCFFIDYDNQQVYYFNVTTGECRSVLPESYDGHSKQEFIDYFDELNEEIKIETVKKNQVNLLPSEEDYQKFWLFGAHVSSDGKWIGYLSSKWTEDGQISSKNNYWLHNVETGEEILYEPDGLINSVLGKDAGSHKLLPDDRILAVKSRHDGGLNYYTVNILTKEAKRIVKMPKDAYIHELSDRYIMTFDGDATIYDIDSGEIYTVAMGIENYDKYCLGESRCVGDCLAITPNKDVAYVIDLAHYKFEKFTPPDSRYNIKIGEVFEDRVRFDIIHISTDELFGSFIAQTSIKPEPMDPHTRLKLYSRQVEYSSPEYQKFLPEAYDLTPIYEILGDEAADRATSEYYKLDMYERQSIPPLYRLLRDTGITREQFDAYNQTAESKLSDEVIEALYSPYDTKACEALIGRLSTFYNGEAYNLHEAVEQLMYKKLPHNATTEFLNDIAEYITASGWSDIEAVHKVVEEYVGILKSDEPLEDYPAAATEYEKYFIKDISWTDKADAISIEVCDPNTEEGLARWEEIRRENAYETYYLPITVGSKTVDCEIKTVSAGTGEISDISYRTLSGAFRIFGENTRGCYIYEIGGRSIYRFDLATAECTQVLSIFESGKLIEDPTHYEHIPRGPDEAGYPLQASPDGKWLLYRSDKWLKEDVNPREEYHTWLYNIESGEEFLLDDVAIYATGYEKQFEYLLADNKILVSGEDSDGTCCYSIVDIPTKKAEKILTVPANILTFAVSENYILYYEAPKDENKKAVIAVYDISDGSTHRFRFNKPLGWLYSWDCLGKCIAIRNDGHDETVSGAIVMNLEDDTAVNLIIPDNLQYGSMIFELMSERLVRVTESASGFTMYIAVWTGLERQARDTSLAGRLYGRHVEYTAKEYQKFIPEVYDLTPIYGILGEEKAAAAIADYYSLTCKERQALPPLYRLIHGTGITKEQLIKYNQTAQNKLSDDVIEALYLDRSLASTEAVRVKQALLAESSLYYDGNAYSLNEVISTSLPYNVKAEYFGRVEGYVRKNCSDDWIRLVNQVKESYDEIATAANVNVGETLYSFEKTAVQGDKTVDYRIDVVCTGKDRHQTSTPNDTTVWGEFELRAFDKNGKQTGSVKLYNGSPGNQFGAMGLDTKNISRAFNPIIAKNIISFSTPNSQIKEGNSIVTIYGITFSGELFMYEIEDSEDFTYISSNAGAGPINRVFTNALIASDLYSYIRPNFEGDSPDTRYLHESYDDYDIRQISFYQIDDENRRIIPKIFVNGYYVADIVDSVISEQKPNANDALFVKTSENEAYVYYIADWLHPSEKSGIYYRKTVMDENGEWHAEGETMRVKAQADVAKWFEPFGQSVEDSKDKSEKQSAELIAANENLLKFPQWYTLAGDPPPELYDELKFTKVEVPKGIELVNRLASGKWFAYDRRQSFPDTGINNECVYNPENGEVEKISIPDNFPGWLYGSTDAFIGGRYLYYWLSYSDGTEKLTEIDFDEHTAEVIYSYDDGDYNWNDVYPIDDESYISCLTKLEKVGGRTAYSITCELRKTDGTAIPLPDSLYIDDGKNSSGLFPRCFFGDDGRIRALCEETVNSVVRYYICDFSREGNYIGRTELTGIEDIVAEGRLSSCVKEGEYAYLGDSHLVKLQDSNATRILTNGKIYSSVFTQDRFVYYYSFNAAFSVYNMDTTALYFLDLQKEIPNFDADDFWYLDIKDIGNGELLLCINKWKNPNEYYILSNY